MGLGSDAVLSSNPNSFISLHPFSLQAKCPLLSKGPADSSQCNSRETHGGHMAGVERRRRRRRSDYHTPSIHTRGQADIREDVKIPTWGLFGKSGTQPSSLGSISLQNSLHTSKRWPCPTLGHLEFTSSDFVQQVTE